MAKKLPPPPEPVPPPEGLSEKSRQLGAVVVPLRAKDAERQAIVEQALRSLDRAEAARLAIAEAGMTTQTKTTGAVHVHPLVKVEREARQQFMRAWEALGLSQDLSAWERAHRC